MLRRCPQTVDVQARIVIQINDAGDGPTIAASHNIRVGPDYIGPKVATWPASPIALTKQNHWHFPARRRYN